MKYEKGTISTIVDIFIPILLAVMFLISIWINNVHTYNVRRYYVNDMMAMVNIIASTVKTRDDFYERFEMISEHIYKVPNRTIYIHSQERGFILVAGENHLVEEKYVFLDHPDILENTSGYIIQVRERNEYHVYFHWVHLEDIGAEYLALLVITGNAFILEWVNLIMYICIITVLAYLIKINFVDRSIYTSIYIRNQRYLLKEMENQNHDR